MGVLYTSLKLLIQFYLINYPIYLSRYILRYTFEAISIFKLQKVVMRQTI
jgi:hypothetical protein